MLDFIQEYFFELLYTAFLLPQLILWCIIVPSQWKVERHHSTSNNEGVSVIVAARNEEHHLPRLLDHLVNQEYPEFEIIIINDRSSDQSSRIIREYQQKHNIIKEIVIDDNFGAISPKKFALSKGIPQAKYNQLLFTDADCVPASNQWIKLMTSKLSTHPLTLGIGWYLPKHGLLVEKFTQFETLITALQYVSFSRIGINYMGVGRNIAYTKALYTSGDGFESHKNVLSGDDDLFINQVANKDNTATIIHPDSLTYSQPPSTWKKWYFQKLRHLSAGHHYKLSNKLLLGALSTSHLSVYFIYLLLLPLNVANLLYLSLMLIIRLVAITICTRKFTRMTNTKFSWWFIPIMDFMLIAYQIIIGASSVISKRNTWI
ncbi:glycosyltransferase [Flammeovirga sp. MY04]|uniref:glycosyltransferase n=1 Tax=Flammeovirga sp. MY04 TaxID=1191459 RepID=UPI0008063F76|nr:glycosyltransferase [Flammeovirga sp. MY04]ANQ49984.1 glycosyltransferase [Flammeovirga sp. MY04]